MALPSGIKESASLADFLQLVRQRKALILLLLTTVVIVTLGVTAFLPKWYLATTKVRVEKPEGEVKLFQAQSSNSYDPYFLLDEFKVMQSEKILYPVIAKLGLNARIARSLGSTTELPNATTFSYMLQKMVRVEAPRNTSVIEINIYAQDPALAADIANEIARVYSEDRINEATSGQREGLAELEKQLKAQEETVSRQRDVVESLRRSLNIAGVDLADRSTNIDIERLQQMQSSLIALRADAMAKRTRYESFRAIPAADRITLINSELIPDTNIQNLLQAYLVAGQEVTRLSGTFGEEHPDMKSARERQATMRQQLDAQLRGYETSLGLIAAESAARVAQLEKDLQQAQSDQITSAQERRRPFDDATEKLDQETRLLSVLSTTLRQKQIDFQVPKKTIEILNTAEPARWPSRPNWTLNTIVALLFGALLGLGVAVSLEYFDTSFRGISDVERRLNLPVLGVIPASRDPRRDIGHDPAEGEPYRVLQTNLNLTLKSGVPSSLVIFSAGPGEGKSTTLHHLTNLMAQTGERVLLVDSDVRRPRQHDLLNRPKTPGLTDLLTGSASFDAVVQRGVLPNLDFIPSGGRGDFTLGLLHVNRLRDLIATARAGYDKIVFDSPPIIGVSDASVLASVVDGAILLIQHRRNPASMVMRAHQILTGLKVPILGVVLNQVPLNAGDEIGYYTNNYGYYSSKEPKAESGASAAKSPDNQDRLKLG